MELSYIPLLAAILTVLITVAWNIAFNNRQEVRKRISIFKVVKNEISRIRTILDDKDDNKTISYLYPEWGIYRKDNVDVFSINFEHFQDLIKVYEYIIYLDHKYRCNPSGVEIGEVKKDLQKKMSKRLLSSIIVRIDNGISLEEKSDRFSFIMLVLIILLALILIVFYIGAEISLNHALGNDLSSANNFCSLIENSSVNFSIMIK